MEVRVATEKELRTIEPIPEPRHSLLQSRRPSTAWSGSRDLRAKAVRAINDQWETLHSGIANETEGLSPRKPGSPGWAQSRGLDAGAGEPSSGRDKAAFKISNIPKGADRKKLELISRSPKDDGGNVVPDLAKEYPTMGLRSCGRLGNNILASPRDRLQDERYSMAEDCSQQRPATAAAGPRVRFAEQGNSTENCGDAPKGAGSSSVTWRVRTEHSDLTWIKSLVQYAEDHPIYIRDEKVNEVVYQPTGQWQHVIFPSACPTRREDVLMLEQWLAGILLNVEQIRFPAAAPSACHVQAASMKGLRRDNEDDTTSSRNGIAMAEAALVVYNTAFCEIVRQVELNCKERSQLLWTVWTHYFHLVNALKIMEFNGQLEALQSEIKRLEGQLKVELSCFGEEEKKLQEKLFSSEAALEQEQYSSEFVQRNLATRISKLEKELQEAKENQPRFQDQITDLIQTKIGLERAVNKEISLRFEAETEAGQQAAAAKTILEQYQTLQAELHILRRSEKVAVQRAEEEAALVTRLQTELDDETCTNQRMDAAYVAQKAEFLHAKMKLSQLEAVEEELERERDWHEQTKVKCQDLQKRCSDIEFLHEKLFKECAQLEKKGQTFEAALLVAEDKVTEQENRSKFLEQSVLGMENLYHQEKKRISELLAGIEIMNNVTEQLHSSLTEDPICQHKISQRICHLGSANDALFVAEARKGIESLTRTDPLATDDMSMALGEAFECLDDLLASDWDSCDILIKTQKIVIASSQHIRSLRNVFRSTWRKHTMVERRLEMESKERRDLDVQLFEQKTACERLSRALEYEKAEAASKDIRTHALLDKKDQDLESEKNAITDLQDRITTLVQDFQHQEQRALQAHEESIALLKDHEDMTEKMRVLQLTVVTDKDEMSKLKDEIQELQAQVVRLSQELAFEKEERDCAIQAYLASNHDTLSMDVQLKESENKVVELEKANQILVRDLHSAHQLVWYARAFFKNLIDAKSHIECLDPSVGYGDPHHGQTVDITNVESAAAQSHLTYIGAVKSEPPLLLRLKSALLKKSNQFYRAQLAIDLKNRVETEEQLIAESRSFEDDLFIQMRCVWAEESSALRRITKQVALLKTGLAELVQLAELILKETKRKEQIIRKQCADAHDIKAKLDSETTTQIVDEDEMKANVDSETTTQRVEDAVQAAKPRQPRDKKVKFLDEWEQRIEKMSIHNDWEQGLAKPTYLATTQCADLGTCADTTYEHKFIQVPEDLQQVDVETLIRTATPLSLSSDPNMALSRKKLIRLAVRIYTEGVNELEKLQQFTPYNSRTRPEDGIVIKLQVILREIHGLEEGPQKFLECLGSCTSYLDDPKVSMFARFCGLLQPVLDHRAFQFHLEVLYCIKQLLGVNWRAVVREWQQGTTAIPEALALCVLGNAYNVAAPVGLPVYLRRLQPVLKESRSGMLVDLDTLLLLLCEEFADGACPVYPLTCPRRMAPGYFNPTQLVEDKLQKSIPIPSPGEVGKYVSR